VEKLSEILRSLDSSGDVGRAVEGLADMAADLESRAIKGTCSQCTHWEGYCGTAIGKGFHACNLPEWKSEGEKMGASEIGYYAEALDDSGMSGGVVTGPDFGCINFAVTVVRKK